jgi:hypothetical protein
MSNLESLQLELFSLQKQIVDLSTRIEEMKRRERRANAPAMKVCIKCKGDPKPREQFYLDARYVDGLYPYCRPCKAEYYRRRKVA